MNDSITRDRSPETWKTFQPLGEELRAVNPWRMKRRKLLQLLDPDRRLDLGHSIVEADEVHDVVDSLVLHDDLAVIPDQCHSLREIGVIRHYDAALASMNCLVIIEAEHSDVSERSCVAALVCSTGNLCRILDHDEIALARNFESADKREAAMLTYVRGILETDGTPPRVNHEDALEAGWSDEQLLEALERVQGDVDVRAGLTL